MNKVQQTAGKVFTPEFLILVQSIPQQYIDEESVSKLIKYLDKHTDKKKISDCLIALSFYLTTIIVNNEDIFDDSFSKIKEMDISIKTEQYIR